VQETWGVFDDVFCAGNDSTFTFLQNVIDEVNTLFPSKYFHIGGDECPKTHWKTCPRCQQRMKDLKLKDEHELQSYFVQRIEKYLNSKGKTLIGWDEILEGGLAPNAIVMSWRGEKGGIEAAQQKHTVIMTPGNPVYFDHTQSANEDSVTIGGYNSLEKVYAYEPVPKELNEAEGKYVLGAQANLWTEYVKYPSKAEYMLFPRMSALSEVLWSSKENRQWDNFERKLKQQVLRYHRWKANYSKAFWDLQATVTPTDNNQGLLWKLETKDEGAKIQYNKTLTADDAPNPPAFQWYDKPVLIVKSGEYNAWSVQDGKNMDNLIKQNIFINKATGKKITLAVPATPKYPGDGPFTLVNGVQNTRGLARTKEFLGFDGNDCIATIDLGAPVAISEVVIHGLELPASWIWSPSAVDIARSEDGQAFTALGTTTTISKSSDKSKTTIKLASPVTTRYIKISVFNHGVIAAGNAGAGHKAWLFVDEIEVN
jgi:hexosaminidase